MRVAHVHRMRGIGGSERHLLTLLPALAERGVEPVFIGLDDPAWDPADFYNALTVPTVRIPAPRDVDPLLLARVLRHLDAEIVHTHLVHADLYGGIAAKLRGRRLVSTKHNDDPFRAGPFRIVERQLARLADRIVTISDSLHRFTVEQVGIPERKVETIHYGLDALPQPWGANPPDPVPEGARILLAVSRLTEQKGLDTLVGIVRDLPEDVVLVVLGDGPLRKELERDRVFLLGRVPDVAAWLRRASVFVHPARWEGFGLAVLEAMLAGLPVVASAAGSLPELVRDGETGFLVSPGDERELLAAVERALEHPELGAAGLERARSEFSVARMADRTAALYAALASASS